MTKVVHVKWHDASAASGWHSRKELKYAVRSELALCETVGMLVNEGKDKLVLIQTFGTNEVSGVFEIPAKCVKSIKTLTTLPIKIEL